MGKSKCKSKTKTKTKTDNQNEDITSCFDLNTPSDASIFVSLSHDQGQGGQGQGQGQSLGQGQALGQGRAIFQNEALAYILENSPPELKELALQNLNSVDRIPSTFDDMKQNGLSEGAIQLAKDMGRPDDLRTLFETECMQKARGQLEALKVKFECPEYEICSPEVKVLALKFLNDADKIPSDFEGLSHDDIQLAKNNNRPDTLRLGFEIECITKAKEQIDTQQRNINIPFQYPNQPYQPYYPNQPYPQQPYSQQTYPQQPYSQQTYPQHPYPQQPYPQQPYPQQPYPQQPYPQQPYPQQPYQPNMNVGYYDANEQDIERMTDSQLEERIRYLKNRKTKHCYIASAWSCGS
eukprot:Pgem_evm1s2928